MELTISEKIRLIIKRKKLGFASIAEALGCSRQNLNQKILRNTWTVDGLEQVADAIGCDLKITLIDRETGEEY